MSSNAFNAGFIRTELLEKCVIRLKIKHASALSISSIRCWLNVHHVKGVHIDVMLWIVEMWKLIARVEFIWRVICINQIRVIVVDNYVRRRSLCGAIFSDDFNMRLMIGTRVCIHLIGCRKVVIYSIDAIKDVR